MTLTNALGMARDEAVAIVGGGGKTSAMFRLAREVAESGGRAITTTTTRIFAAQIALAPAHVRAAEATPERIAAALAAHHTVLVIGPNEPETGKAEGIAPELFSEIRARFRAACLLNEADGSRMRPFKAPAAHEPVIPCETTLVVPVVGADVFGQPLDAERVHRPELVSALTGAPLGTPVTPHVVAGVLAHPQGGRKGVPEGARIVVLINKVERLTNRQPAYDTAALLLREPAIDRVVLTTLRSDNPVLEVLER